MSPVFLIVVAIGLLAGRLMVVRRMSADGVTPAHRQTMEESMTGLWAFIAPLVGVVLCVLGLLLAAESGRSRWLLFLAAVLFSADLVLVLRQRRRLTGRWIGVGGSTTGARARARHLSVLAAFCLVGFYALTWSAEQEAGIWTLVPAYALLVTFLVLMVAVGFSMITALQTREEDELQRGE